MNVFFLTIYLRDIAQVTATPLGVNSPSNGATFDIPTLPVPYAAADAVESDNGFSGIVAKV